jgi:hypothetical protein
MHQRTIAFDLRIKGLSAEAIVQDVGATFGTEAVAYSTVTRWLRTPKFAGQDERAHDEAELTGTELFGKAIMKAIRDNPLSPVRELSRLACLSRSTVHRHLTESLVPAVSLLCSVPQRLADNQNMIRVTLFREPLQAFQKEQACGWHNIVSLDEAWFYFLTDDERIWPAPGESVRDRGRHMIQSLILMIPVAWNPNGFHVVAALQKGNKFNVGYYTTEILQRMKDWRGNQAVLRIRR